VAAFRDGALQALLLMGHRFWITGRSFGQPPAHAANVLADAGGRDFQVFGDVALLFEIDNDAAEDFLGLGARSDGGAELLGLAEAALGVLDSGDGTWIHGRLLSILDFGFWIRRAQRGASGPEGRQVVAPTVRSGIRAVNQPHEAPEGRHMMCHSQSSSGVSVLRTSGAGFGRLNPWPDGQGYCLSALRA